MNDQTSEYQFIETDAELVAFAEWLSGKKKIAVDLEADSMYHFKEKVCLLQISSGKAHAVVDPLKISDMSPLKPIFASAKIRKIFHGADYDIRSLYRDFGIEISNLFDTQIAARFLGAPNTGLDSLLQERMNISLDKRYQKQDWSMRPLPKAMTDYAASDVIHLITLADMLMAELKTLDRWPWVREECECLCKVRPSNGDGLPLFMRVKGAGKLKPQKLAVLEALLQLRAEHAGKKDRPPFKIIGNESLLRIADVIPNDARQLTQIGALSQKQLDMYAKEIIRSVTAAMQLPANQWPVYPRKKSQSLTATAADRINRLKQWRDQQAAALGLDPAIVLTKTLIGLIAEKNPKTLATLKTIEELKAWQIKAFGGQIVNALKKSVP